MKIGNIIEVTDVHTILSENIAVIFHLVTTFIRLSWGVGWG
jgi:hypothetical protein